MLIVVVIVMQLRMSLGKDWLCTSVILSLVLARTIAEMAVIDTWPSLVFKTLLSLHLGLYRYHAECTVQNIFSRTDSLNAQFLKKWFSRIIQSHVLFNNLQLDKLTWPTKMWFANGCGGSTWSTKLKSNKLLFTVYHLQEITPETFK